MKNRWVQLCIGIVAMVMIANLQYAWTLFVGPMSDKQGWTKAEIQGAFAVFVLFQTWLVPVNGFLVDRIGPKPFLVLAGILVGASWLIDAHAGSLGMLYLGAVLGGIGAGSVYGTMIGAAVKNFADRRGLAAGLTAAGFGGGAVLSVIPISNMIAHQGYQATFERFGIIQGIVIVIAALFVVRPAADTVLAVNEPPRTAGQSRRAYTPQQMLTQPHFYLLYAMFVLIAIGLLFMTAQVAVLAKDYGVAKSPINVVGIVVLTLQLALIVDSLLNGISRIIFGYVSDFIGRERTMFTAFTIEAVALFGLLVFASSPWGFVIFAGLTFVASGEIYSLFPAACTDLFGSRYATTNCGLLYTAKGTAALLIPVANAVHDATGTWSTIICVLAVCNIVVALAAIFILKPMRERALAAENAGYAGGGLRGAPTG